MSRYQPSRGESYRWFVSGGNSAVKDNDGIYNPDVVANSPVTNVFLEVSFLRVKN